MSEDSIDPEMLTAAEQTIAIAGWPSRERAPAWLAVILQEATSAAIEQAVGAMAAEMAQVRQANAVLMGANERLARLREADAHPHGSMAEHLRNQAVLAEREACAQIVVRYGVHTPCIERACASEQLASLIRARK